MPAGDEEAIFKHSGLTYEPGAGGERRLARRRAGAGDHSPLRASRADREQVIDALKAAFVDGRLAKDEFDLRVGRVLAAHADLDALTADIPAPARTTGLQTAGYPGP